MKESRFLKFQDLTEPDKKTRTICISTKGPSDSCLGWIKWYGAWRRYVFMPEPDMVFDIACMEDIIEVIKDLMDERKRKQIAEKA